jgi:hypothetical protein
MGTLACWFRTHYKLDLKWLRCAIKSRAPKRRRRGALDARFLAFTALKNIEVAERLAASAISLGACVSVRVFAGGQFGGCSPRNTRKNANVRQTETVRNARIAQLQ